MGEGEVVMIAGRADGQGSSRRRRGLGVQPAQPLPQLFRFLHQRASLVAAPDPHVHVGQIEEDLRRQRIQLRGAFQGFDRRFIVPHIPVGQSQREQCLRIIRGQVDGLFERVHCFPAKTALSVDHPQALVGG